MPYRQSSVALETLGNPFETHPHTGTAAKKQSLHSLLLRNVRFYPFKHLHGASSFVDDGELQLPFAP